MKRAYLTVIVLLFSVSLSAYAQEITIETKSIPLSLAIPECSGGFVPHTLDHITTTPSGDNIRQFEANGSGLAINDLDNDGDQDIVLGNHAGMNSILWNNGNLNFTSERLSHGDSRAVTIIDIDGDGWNDIVFTRTVSAPSYWHNLGNGSFELEFLPGISQPLYSIAWADLDSDGDLDLVGGSYDAALLDAFGQEFLINPQGGIYYYENDDGLFRPSRLAYEAQALALILVDINDDSRLDIVVGNDFAVPDYVWIQTDDGWLESDVFRTFSYSTMSYDFADMDNDGLDELFSSDMKPYPSENQAEAWQPILDGLQNSRRAGDPQITENVLLKPLFNNTFYNAAREMDINASGWSWSAKFGDLDQDGYLDLYIVNGFIEFTIFADLDNHELVEENQVFRNISGTRFESMPDWGLSSTSSGRGMSMADLDMDGDLDIVVNNLRKPAQLFENQLCTGNSLQVDIVWDSTVHRSSIGTELILHTDAGNLTRSIKSSSGYLSGDPTRIHFGIPSTSLVQSLEIIWTDGEQTILDISPDINMLVVKRIDDGK